MTTLWSNRTMDTIGSRLRARRDQRRLTLRQLSVASDVTIPQIHKYERGIHEPTAPVLRRLADALEVSIDELVP